MLSTFNNNNNYYFLVSKMLFSQGDLRAALRPFSTTNLTQIEHCKEN